MNYFWEAHPMPEPLDKCEEINIEFQKFLHGEPSLFDKTFQNQEWLEVWRIRHEKEREYIEMHQKD